MPRSLSDGKIKFTILTAAPADPAAPTIAELNGGIDASCAILSSDFLWGATDSDKVAEKALCVTNNANALGASNYQAGITPFRYLDGSGASAPTEGDDVFQAVKVKGALLYGYARKTSLASTADWVADDEIYLGGSFITDEAQPPSDLGGYIKWRVPCEIQVAYPFITAVAGI